MLKGATKLPCIAASSFMSSNYLNELYRKILLENNAFKLEGVALLMNQSFAFKLLSENFQAKLINSYSNSERLLDFL